jgi:formylglycine-generating enzyme required for sulfatase activity
MGAAEVTQGQWKALMGKNPSFFDDDTLPVDTVAWPEAMEFCRKLSDKEEGVSYRLPTEAEWEYACRAGTVTPFHTGATISTSQANYHGGYTYGNGRKGQYRETSTAAGTFAPNAWSLYDMHGNVWEWCADWFGDYPSSEATDPTGPPEGERRVVRGGCWINFPAVCRSANRGSTVPVSWNFNFGFRVVRVLD